MTICCCRREDKVREESCFDKPWTRLQQSEVILNGNKWDRTNRNTDWSHMCDTAHLSFLLVSHTQSGKTHTHTHIQTDDDVNHFLFSRKDDNTLLRYTRDGIKFPLAPFHRTDKAYLFGSKFHLCEVEKWAEPTLYTPTFSTGHPNRQLHLTNTHCTHKKQVTC